MYKDGKKFIIQDLNHEEKSFKIKRPEEYMLPSMDINTEYIVAKDSNYFIYKKALLGALFF